MAREPVGDDASGDKGFLNRREYLLGTATTALGTATVAGVSGNAVATSSQTEREPEDRWKTLTVVGHSDTDIGNYEVTVSEAIVAAPDDGTTTPNTAVEDAVGADVHTYRFSGEIMDYSLDGPVELHVDN